MDAHDDDMPSDFEAHDSPLLACRFTHCMLEMLFMLWQGG